MKMINGHPRRFRIDKLTPTESSIREALGKVEDLGAHPLLTEAVVLLGAAQDKVADFLEMKHAAAHASEAGRQEIDMVELSE